MEMDYMTFEMAVLLADLSEEDRAEMANPHWGEDQDKES